MQNRQTADTLFLAMLLAAGSGLVALGVALVVGKFDYSPAGFIAILVAAIVWVVLYLTLRGGGSAVARTTDTVAASVAPASAPVPDPVPAPAPQPASSVTPAQAEVTASHTVMAAPMVSAAAAHVVAAPAAADPVATPAPAAMPASVAAHPSATGVAVKKAPAAKKAPATKTATAAKKPAARSAAAKIDPDAPAKPKALKAARRGKPDDLKQIKGIGPKLEELCHRLGFFHFDQIAAWTAQEVAWVDDNLEGFKGRVTRDSWVQQAALLAKGGDTEFSQRVKKGKVY